MKASAVEVRRGRDRGTMKTSWLDAKFSFSFADWRAPGRDAFRSLRALNEDVIQPATGFGMHPHRDLDIFMLPLEGEIAHADSLGNRSVVVPGQVHRMRAGTGIRHSQMNASATALDHHLQVWFTPRVPGGTPFVETRDFDLFSGGWCRVATADGRDGSFRLDHDATMSTARVLPGVACTYPAGEGADLYLHVIDGSVVHDGHALAAGDALAIENWGGRALHIEGRSPSSRLLMFEFGPLAR
jgi:quercetin 2,3-dioxygenase